MRKILLFYELYSFIIYMYSYLICGILCFRKIAINKIKGVDSMISSNKSQELEKERIISLDVIRSLAILFVIITHASDLTYLYAKTTETVLGLSQLQRLFSLSLHVIGRCGVPLFFFLTGYLILPRDFSKPCAITKFWRKSLLPLIITSSIWGIIYYFYGVIIDGKILDWGRLIREVLFFERYEATHFWYIPVIIGLYLFIPFVSILLSKVNSKIIFRLGLFSLLYMTIPATINPFLNVLKLNFQLSPILDLSWSGGYYGLLTLIGYLFHQKGSILKHYWLWLPIGISCFSFLLWQEYYCFTNQYAYDLWYNNTALIILCISIFAIILPIKKVIIPKLFTWICKHTFGIYLIHNIFVDYYSKHTTLINYHKFFYLFIIATLLSILLVWILGLNKKIGKIMILVK